MSKLSDIIDSFRLGIVISLLACIALFLNSCLEEPQVQLLQVDREYVDSIFTNSIDSLSDLSDSLCLIQREELFDFLVDSIKQKRLEEIQSIFDKK